jgi:hypothetical protein
LRKKEQVETHDVGEDADVADAVGLLLQLDQLVGGD